MFDVIHSVRNLLNRTESSSGEDDSIKVIKSRKEIMKAIFKALENHSVLGVYSPVLGDGLFLTGVLFLETDHPEPIVTFNRYDHNGILLNRTELGISEIKGACLFKMKYQNPLLKKVVLD